MQSQISVAQSSDIYCLLRLQLEAAPGLSSNSGRAAWPCALGEGRQKAQRSYAHSQEPSLGVAHGTPPYTPVGSGRVPAAWLSRVPRERKQNGEHVARVHQGSPPIDGG